MATNLTTSPGEQSDAPHGKPGASKGDRKRRYLLTAVIVLLVVLTGAAMPLVVDDEPQHGSLWWSEMAPPVPPEPGLQADPDAPAPDPQALAELLDPMVSGLKHDAGAVVYDGITGDVLYESGAQTPLTPASSTKLTTAAAVLAARGPGYRIPTRVVTGAEPGAIVLVAGGDVTLSKDGDGHYDGAGSLADLAEQVKASLGDQPVTSITVDTSVYGGDLRAQGVPASDTSSGFVASAVPAMIDGGRVDPDGEVYSTLHDDPLGTLVTEFAGMLSFDQYVSFDEGEAADNAEELGVVYSPTVERMVEQALLPSDNTLADALARQVALASGEEQATFDNSAAAVLSILADSGVPVDGAELHDGSGMSPDGKLSPETLASIVLQAASGDHPEFSGLLSGLPVAGYSGSLDRRYPDDSNPAVGRARAKTGTLNKVSSLTGMTVDTDGRLLVFGLILNGEGDGHAAETGIDGIVSAVTGCGCR